MRRRFLHHTCFAILVFAGFLSAALGQGEPTPRGTDARIGGEFAGFRRDHWHEEGIVIPISFHLPQRFDLAVLLMDSASYLLDNDAVLRHLACVAAHLYEGGLYVLEMGHPRDAFRTQAGSTESVWTAEEDGLRPELLSAAAVADLARPQRGPRIVLARPGQPPG